MGIKFHFASIEEIKTFESHEHRFPAFTLYARGLKKGDPGLRITQ